MKNRISISIAVVSVFLAGCGSGLGTSVGNNSGDGANTTAPGQNGGTSSSPATVGGTGVAVDGVVVHSQSMFQINTDGSGAGAGLSALNLDTNFPISVINSASSTMTLNTGLFKIPTISSQLLDFGYIDLTALSDNNLDVCGTAGNQHCGTALIRVYTTGTAGPGLYNSTGGYGAPITAGTASPLLTVGLGTGGAAVLQSITIPATKNVVHLTDFSSVKYDVKVDFSNAGAGSYSTTLVVEYALSP